MAELQAPPINMPISMPINMTSPLHSASPPPHTHTSHPYWRAAGCRLTGAWRLTSIAKLCVVPTEEPQFQFGSAHPIVASESPRGSSTIFKAEQPHCR